MGEKVRFWFPSIGAGLVIMAEVATNFLSPINTAYIVIGLLVVQIVLYDVKVRKVENTRPNIKVQRVYEDYRDVIIPINNKGSETGTTGTSSAYTLQVVTGGTVLPGTVPANDSRRIELCRFAHIVFANEPKSSYEFATAEKVWVT